MHRHILTHSNGLEFCTTDYEEANHWVRTTWHGFVTAQDGEGGAVETLRLLGVTHAAYLLNDNSQIEGPWFDSIEWLERVWAPQAKSLGLRAVAHVMQPDPNAGLEAAALHNPFDGLFDMQLFTTVAEAEIWLRECQARDELTPTV
jgi:hypothetical protein